jgi:hypothetical protein
MWLNSLSPRQEFWNTDPEYTKGIVAQTRGADLRSIISEALF